jgi:hypothetical protein
MEKSTSPARLEEDCRQISLILFKLALPRVMLRLFVGALAFVIWYEIARRVLDFGRHFSFDFLHTLGPQAMDIFARMNPYLWWGAVTLWTVIALFILRAWFAVSLESGRLTPIRPEILADLIPHLCAEVVSVVRWTWTDRREPYTVGDLRRALFEIRHNRIGKMRLAVEQIDILDTAAGRPSQAQAQKKPLAHSLEPHIGSAR